MVHYYYGYGKGKTSAAAGACLRATGSGMRCAFVQFLKNGDSGEVGILRRGIADVYDCGGKADFPSRMSEAQKAELREVHNVNLRAVLAGGYDLIVLDELGDSIDCELVDTEAVGEILAAPGELVITGHTATPQLMSRADYITEFRSISHPYDRGVPARKGIEY